MKIRMNNLSPSGDVSDAVNSAINGVLASGKYILGENVEAFEDAWAQYVSAPYCVACGNGFDAIQLVLRGTGVRDVPVGVSEKTCLPTWAAVLAAGCLPVPLTHANASTSVVVHLYGNADIDTLATSDFVIQDACQAHGSYYNSGDRALGRVGSIGTCTWSFYPTKNLGGYGDSGAITTHSRAIYEQVLSLRSYGTSEPGINSRMDELQAAILLAKLPFLSNENASRKRHAWIYDELINWNMQVSRYAYGLGANYHQYVVMVRNRNEFIEFLRDNGIETGIHYQIPPYRHPAIAHMAKQMGSILWQLDNIEEWAETCVSLPVAGHLSDDDISFVAETINRYLEIASES